MKRAISLCLIFAICLGVYWTRIQSAEAKAAVTSVTGKVAVCLDLDRDELRAAIAACDALLAVPDLEPTTRGYFLFYKAYALDLANEDDAALAVYDEAEPLTRMKRRWVLNNRGWIHVYAKRWDKGVADAQTILTERPDLRDGPYFGALMLLWKRADVLGDEPEKERLANLYLTEEPQGLYAVKYRMRVLEKEEDHYPDLEVRLARISDLSRVIEAEPDSYDHYEKRFKLFAELDLMRHAIVGGRRFLELASKEALSGAENSKEDADDLEVLRLFTETTAQHMLRKVQADVLKEAQDADALVQRAWAHYALGDLDLALADLDLALVDDPTKADVKNRRDQVAKVRVVLARHGLLEPSHLTQP